MLHCIQEISCPSDNENIARKDWLRAHPEQAEDANVRKYQSGGQSSSFLDLERQFHLRGLWRA